MTSYRSVVSNEYILSDQLYIAWKINCYKKHSETIILSLHEIPDYDFVIDYFILSKEQHPLIATLPFPIEIVGADYNVTVKKTQDKYGDDIYHTKTFKIKKGTIAKFRKYKEIEELITNIIKPYEKYNYKALWLELNNSEKIHTENNILLKKYFRMFINDELFEPFNASLTFAYQLGVLRQYLEEMSKSIMLKEVRLSPSNLFKDSIGSHRFLELICALDFIGVFTSCHIMVNNKIIYKEPTTYEAIVSINDLEKFNINFVREMYGLDQINQITPSMANKNYIYQNNSLTLKLSDGSIGSITLTNAPQSRYIFETFYELHKYSPPDKKSFTRSEIIKTYKHLHKGAPEIDLQDIEPGKLGEIISNCKSVMFKGENKNYKDRIIWYFDKESDGYYFDIK